MSTSTPTALNWPEWLTVASQRYDTTDDIALQNEGITGPGVNYICYWREQPELRVSIAVDDVVAQRLDKSVDNISRMIAAAIKRKLLDQMIEECAREHGYAWTEDTRSTLAALGNQPVDLQKESLEAGSREFDLGLTPEQIGQVIEVVAEFTELTKGLEC